MPKQTPRPDYDSDVAIELIWKWIHDKVDRRMLYLRLIDGYTFQKIANAIHEEEGILFEEKTVRTRVNKGERIVFSHYPE